MNDSVTVSPDDLKLVIKNIREKKDEIMEIYHSSLEEVLTLSTECFKKNGDSYEDVCFRFQKLFKDFDYCVTELIEVMDGKIVPGYEDLSDNIKLFFNQQFAKKISSLLDIEK